MLIEVSRVRRRLTAVKGPKQVNGIALGLVLVCYAIFLALLGYFPGEIPPVALVLVQTVIFTMVAPGLLYTSIAGERERRSWDLLLAAPITKAQIVAGKFIGAMSALAVGAGLFLVPILMTAVTYHRTSLYDVWLAEMVSLSFIALVCSFTILISARVKRALTALGTVIGTLGIFLVALPALIGTALGSPSSTDMDFFMFAHPIMALGRIMDSSGYSYQAVSNHLFGWPHIVLYSIFTLIFLVWTERTLTFAENDVKFLPQPKDNA